MQLPQFKLELNHDEPRMGEAKCKTTWKIVETWFILLTMDSKFQAFGLLMLPLPCNNQANDQPQKARDHPTKELQLLDPQAG